jgi:hypothetical protein
MGKYLWDEASDPALILQVQEDKQAAAAMLPAVPLSVRARLTPQEEKVLELMRRKERRTAVYAAALGIVDHPAHVQRREVKKMKDRLSKRLERAEHRDV